MTIDEALKLIKGIKECFIVWRTDTGEIVKVNDLGDKVSDESFVENLSQMTSDIDVKEINQTIQFASRFLNSEIVNKEFLEQERDEFLKRNLRVKVLNQWTEQPVIELISILETQNFPYPTSESDTYILLERLFDFHWQEIDELDLKRLWRLTQSKSLPKRLWRFAKNESLSERNIILLKFHLLFLEKKTTEFVEFYKETFKDPFHFVSYYTDYYIGDLQITDEQIIKNYQEILNHPRVMFGTKYPAMIALGKIGNASGEESAKTIEKAIYDSEEYIIKARNLVLKRIRTPSTDWERCPKCYFGRVQGNYGNMITMQDCADCVGLGWIEKQ